MNIKYKIIFAICILIGFFGKVDFASANQKDTQENINTYILEMYKLQGDTILKNLDNSFKKTFKTKEKQIEAFNTIQQRLSFKRDQVKREYNRKTPKTQHNSEILLVQYLDYMIFEIEKHKQRLQKS